MAVSLEDVSKKLDEIIHVLKSDFYPYPIQDMLATMMETLKEIRQVLEEIRDLITKLGEEK